MLKKCVGDPSLIVPEDVGVTDSLSYLEVPIEILDRQVCRLRTKDAASVKVIWRNQKVEEATWKDVEDMKAEYPFLFHKLTKVLKVRVSFFSCHFVSLLCDSCVFLLLSCKKYPNSLF